MRSLAIWLVVAACIVASRAVSLDRIRGKHRSKALVETEVGRVAPCNAFYPAGLIPLAAGRVKLPYSGISSIVNSGPLARTIRWDMQLYFHDNQLFMNYWDINSNEANSKRCYRINYFYHHDDAVCIGINYNDMKEDALPAITVGTTVNNERMCLDNPGNLLTPDNANLLLARFALHRFPTTRDNKYTQVRAKLLAMFGNTVDLPFTLNSPVTATCMQQSAGQPQWVNLVAVPATGLDSLTTRFWGEAGPKINVILTIPGETITYTDLTSNTELRFSTLGDSRICAGFNKITGLKIRSPEIGHEVDLLGFNLYDFQLTRQDAAANSWWHRVGVLTNKFELAGPADFQESVKQVLTSFWNSGPVGQGLITEMAANTADPVRIRPSNTMECRAAAREYPHRLVDQPRNGMASIPANRDVLRQAVIAWGHAQTGGNAIVACNQLPPAVPDDCIRDATAALSQLLAHAPVVLERALREDEYNAMGDPARAVAVGPNPILVDYGNNKRLYAANPLSQDWGLPACGHVEQLPNDPLQKQQRLTALRDEWRDGLRAIIADANNGRACGAEQAAVNYPLRGVNSVQQLAMLIQLGPYLPGAEENGATLSVWFKGRLSSETYSNRLEGTFARREPAIGQFHELCHAWASTTGRRLFPEGEQFDECWTAGLPPWHNSPYSENKYRAARGDPLRGEYVHTHKGCAVCGFMNAPAAATCQRPNCGHPLPQYRQNL